MPPLEFTQDDLLRARIDWGCNCGPAALAACWKLSLDQVRMHLHRFESVGYVNATDMKSALKSAGLEVSLDNSDGETGVNIYPKHGLCLVQFSGPWFNGPKPSGKWSLRHTHWIASKRTTDEIWIFDVNSGWQILEQWEAFTIPKLIASDKLRDGEFWLKHSWEIRAIKPAKVKSE